MLFTNLRKNPLKIKSHIVLVQVAGTMQALLGGEEIYHYHSKLMMKEVAIFNNQLLGLIS